MNIGNFTAQQVSILTWTAATRTLTDPNAGNINFAAGISATLTTAAVQNQYGAYVQLQASLSHNVRWIIVSMSPAAAKVYAVAFSTGGAGSEVDKSFATIPVTPINDVITVALPVDATLHAKGTRLAAHAVNITDATQVTVSIGVTLIEDNA